MVIYSTCIASKHYVVVYGKHQIAPSDLGDLKSSTVSTKCLSSALVTKSNFHMQWQLNVDSLECCLSVTPTMVDIIPQDISAVKSTL